MKPGDIIVARSTSYDQAFVFSDTTVATDGRSWQFTSWQGAFTHGIIVSVNHDEKVDGDRDGLVSGPFALALTNCGLGYVRLGGCKVLE